MLRRDNQTPVFYPQDIDAAQELIWQIASDYDYENMLYAMIVCPAGKNTPACLALVCDTGEGISIGRYARADLPRLILTGIGGADDE